MALFPIRSSQRNTRLVSHLAWITLAFFVFVVLWGAVVRATGSGGGCGAGWPLCNGDFVPHHPRLATIIEFVHRSSSGTCTVLLLALGILTFRTTPKGHQARTAVLWSAFLLVVEAFLGAVLVLRRYVEDNISTGRVIAQAVHLTNTMLLMAALALTAWYLRGTPLPRPIRESRFPAWLAIIATLTVSATGALAALADTLFPSPSLATALTQDFAASAPVLVRMRWMHPAAALVSFVCVLWLVRSLPAGSRSKVVLLGLLGLQVALGIADVLLLAPTWMQIAHLLGADLYWIALVIVCSAFIWPQKERARTT